MNITVVGQGAIGLLWYHHLYKAKQDVNLICSERILHPPVAMHFTDIQGKTTTSKVIASNQQALSNSQAIIFCLKAYQVTSALEQYLPLVNKEAAIVLCHNGILAKEQLEPWAESHRLFQLLTSHGCKKVDDFTIEHTGLGHSQLGSINTTQAKSNETLCKQLTQVLNLALPTVSWHQDIRRLQWLKLAVNCVINPITALNNVENGELTKASYQREIVTLCQEITQVAATQSIELKQQELLTLVLQVADSTAKNCSSMRADLLHRRKTENEYINGFIYRLSKQHQIACPINNALYQQVAEREHQRITKGDIL